MFLFSLEEKVLPGRMQEYAGWTKKMIELIRELDLGISFSAFGSDDGHMDYNQRIQSQCDYGPKLEAWGKVQDAVLATEWGQRRASAIEWSRYSVWERLTDLSYEPAHPVPDPGLLTHFTWKNVRVRAEKEKELLETVKRVRALLEQKGIERGYNIFRNVIGYEGPLYTIIFAGRDPGESRAWLQEMGRRYAFDLLPYLPVLMASVEKMTDFEGWAMPELSLSVK